MEVGQISYNDKVEEEQGEEEEQINEEVHNIEPEFFLS